MKDSSAVDINELLDDIIDNLGVIKEKTPFKFLQNIEKMLIKDKNAPVARTIIAFLFFTKKDLQKYFNCLDNKQKISIFIEFINKIQPYREYKFEVLTNDLSKIVLSNIVFTAKKDLNKINLQSIQFPFISFFKKITDPNSQIKCKKTIIKYASWSFSGTVSSYCRNEDKRSNFNFSVNDSLENFVFMYSTAEMLINKYIIRKNRIKKNDKKNKLKKNDKKNKLKKINSIYNEYINKLSNIIDKLEASSYSSITQEDSVLFIEFVQQIEKLTFDLFSSYDLFEYLGDYINTSKKKSKK